MILDQSATTKVVFLKLRGLRPGEENETLCSFSVEQTEGMPLDMVDCATIQFDKELMDLMNTVVKQKWFMTKFQGSISLKDMVSNILSGLTITSAVIRASTNKLPAHTVDDKTGKIAKNARYRCFVLFAKNVKIRSTKDMSDA